MQTNGSAIRAIREAKGWNLSKFAAAVGVSHGYMSKIEASKQSAGPAIARRIADTLEVPLAAVTGSARPAKDVA